MTFLRTKFNPMVVGTLTVEQVVSRERSVMSGKVMPIDRTSDKYAEGIKYANEMEYMTISVNNVWGGATVNGGFVSSYEKIGYHTGSADWFAGVVASGCPVFVAGFENDKLTWRKVSK